MPRPQDEIQKRRAIYRAKWRRHQIRQRMKRRDEFNALISWPPPPGAREINHEIC